MTRIHRRCGTTLIELLCAIVIAAVFLCYGLLLVSIARRGEHRTDQAVAAAEQAVLAAGWVMRDLGALEHGPEEPPVAVESVGPATEARIAFRIRDRAAAGGGVHVVYRFDPATGVLERHATPGGVRRFPLGPGSWVLFRKVDPSFAGGGHVQVGRYNNRLVYRITARRDGPHGIRTFTLVGAAPFTVKASRDTFRFWNPGVVDGIRGP
jgi:prepilin-type N-terminal cleavage/methylation domain-containing protein